MKQRGVKMPDDLWAAIQQKAESAGVSAGQWIRSKLSEAVGPPGYRPVDHSGLPDPKERVEAERRIKKADAIVPTSGFRCPMHGCDYSPPSAAARCPDHGRLVVPR